MDLCGETVDMDAAGLFACETVPNLVLGVEICEDLWATEPPSARLARGGATVILNLSASNELVGKSGYRRNLVVGQSGRLVCGYVYADAGEGESTTDLVFTGHNMIAENGALLAERRFATGLTISEIDVDRLAYERRRMTTFNGQRQADLWRASFSLPLEETRLTRAVSPAPFVPADAEDRAERCNEILKIAALGLKKRLEHTGARTAVVGLSGGLDSTLAILITAVAMKLLDRPASDIIAVTMPCFGTTDRTRDNAVELAERLGATLKRIDIGSAVKVHFKDIGQSMEDHSVTFENGQARERTQVLMDIANQNGGWSSAPATCPSWPWAGPPTTGITCPCMGSTQASQRLWCAIWWPSSPTTRAARTHACPPYWTTSWTPQSPRSCCPPSRGRSVKRRRTWWAPMSSTTSSCTTPSAGASLPGRCSVWRSTPWAGPTTGHHPEVAEQLLPPVLTQQFKRSCLPDGPKVGSVTLSPRATGRMPSDAVAALWLEELEGLE